jgi:hypothetical protein
MPKRVHSLPKSITVGKNNKYVVTIYSKQDKKEYHVGTFTTVEESVIARDKWLSENYHLVEGYLPRGITKDRGRYQTQISIATPDNRKPQNIRLKRFGSLQEAVDYRTKFVLGLL